MPLSPVPHVRGLLLAAGAGRRFGGPKALARKDAHGPTLAEGAIEVLLDGGCDGVTVVVGAAADEVTRVLTPLLRRVAPSSTDPDVDLVGCADWAEGMGASLRAGLAALAARPGVEATLVTLVDLPDVGPDVVSRLLSHDRGVTGRGGLEERPGRKGRWRAALGRAAYGGAPGHPALIGREHWDAVAGSAIGDRGARAYFRTHAHDLIECGDLATGRDVDQPEDLTMPD